jgi:hypothetical protein
MFFFVGVKEKFLEHSEKRQMLFFVGVKVK